MESMMDGLLIKTIPPSHPSTRLTFPLSIQIASAQNHMPCHAVPYHPVPFTRRNKFPETKMVKIGIMVGFNDILP